MRLGLGTAQFGMDYGLTNTRGVVSHDDICAILALAAQRQVEVVDTAPAYGQSEAALGRALGSRPFRIVTKVSQVDAMEASFEASLRHLGRTEVYGLLFHRADDLLEPDGDTLMRCAHEFKAQGRVQKVGVSVYTGLQLDRVLERFEVDLVQVPLNVLDQRLVRSGHLARLKERGVEIHVRSMFLQGVLLEDPDRLGEGFASVRPHLHRYHRFLQAHGLSRLGGALAFVAGLAEVDVGIVGVSGLDDWQQILDAPWSDGLDFEPYAWGDEKILNPALW